MKLSGRIATILPDNFQSSQIISSQIISSQKNISTPFILKDFDILFLKKRCSEQILILMPNITSANQAQSKVRNLQKMVISDFMAKSIKRLENVIFVIHWRATFCSRVVPFTMHLKCKKVRVRGSVQPKPGFSIGKPKPRTLGSKPKLFLPKLVILSQNCSHFFTLHDGGV